MISWIENNQVLSSIGQISVKHLNIGSVLVSIG